MCTCLYIQHYVFVWGGRGVCVRVGVQVLYMRAVLLPVVYVL